MNQTCANSWCKVSFEVTGDDLAFLERLSPMIGGRTQELPPPTHCPECRQQRRYACRNDRNYYPGACHVCRKSLITSYSPDKEIPVLCDLCFWSDKWDPLSYGRPYDFQKSFAEQFGELRKNVPRLAIWHTQSEDCEYTVHSSRNRNCYMSSSVVDDEEVHYSDLTFYSKNCLDLFSCLKMELCYECVFCEECYGCTLCDNCVGLSECFLCFDCRGSQQCIGCIGLRNQRQKILNQDATAGEYEETLRRLKTDRQFLLEFRKKFDALRRTHPHPATWMVNAENPNGNYVWNSKNMHRGFNVRRMEDCRFAFEEHSNKDVMDSCRVALGEVLYDCASIVELTYSAFCNLTYQCDHLLYCDNCNGTSECFGCLSLKKHRHCILNTQYSKEEYEALVPKIIEHMRTTGEWGEFFPVTISPFGYNESKAHEWYPLEGEEALTRGWTWSDYELPMPKDVRTIPAEKLPSSIDEVPDDVLNWAITCEVTGKPFRIVKQELQFYRDRGLPIPRRSPKQRHYDRVRPQNIRTLYNRMCGKCGKAIHTIYAPEREEIVYCETCYQKSIY